MGGEKSRVFLVLPINAYPSMTQFLMFLRYLQTVGLLCLIWMMTDNPVYGQNDYSQEWKEVDRLSSSGLPRQALALTDSIHTLAVKEDNGSQRVKAVLQRARLLASLEEDHYEKSIAFLEKEISASSLPLKQVFLSLQAELYWRYFQEQMFRIMNRTALEDPGTVMRYWDARTFGRAIRERYLQSLEPAEALTGISVRNWQAILDTAAGSSLVRPTLYDLLLHRALDYLSSEVATHGLPVLPPYPVSDDLFLPAASFVKIAFHNTNRPETQILQLFQKAMKLHALDAGPESRVALDLARLDYVNRLAGDDAISGRYRQAMHQLLQSHRDHAVSAGIALQLARDYMRTSASFNPPDQMAGKWDRKKAYELCEQAASSFPKAFYASHCRQLMNEISQAGLWLSVSKGVPLHQSSLVLLKYQNVNEALVRLIRVDPEEDRQLRQSRNQDEWLNAYLGRPVHASWQVRLTGTEDYQQHGMEIPVPALDGGYYVLIITPADEKPGPLENTFAAARFSVSDIAYVTRQKEWGGIEILVTDRKSGEPLEAAVISTQFQQYDYRTRRTNLVPGPVFTTDEDGFADLSLTRSKFEHNPVVLHIKHGLDALAPEEQYYLNTGEKPQPVLQERCFLFTDRAVYRPGHTIHYKGILFSDDQDKKALVQGKTVKVRLMDSNGRTLAEQSQTTNKYGSFHSQFTAPAGILLGDCYLLTDYGQVNIRIEEYKRPRFEVTFLPVEGAFRLGDTLSVTGKALSYTTDALAGVRVRYRVERTAWFPYPWYDNWRIYPSGPAQVVKSGETTTRDDGSFEVVFTALGNQQHDMRQAVYRFVVHAEATDITGETHEGKTSLNIGQKTLLISHQIPQRIDRHTGHSYAVSVRNNQDQPVSSLLHLTISRLKEPDRLLRTRLWPRPDMNYMEYEDFIRQFPSDPWGDETTPDRWGKTEPIRSHTYNTLTDSLINLNTLTTMPEGTYLLSWHCVDKYGDTIQRQDVIELFSRQVDRPLFNSYLWTQLSRDQAETGETVDLILSSAFPGSRIWVEIFNSKGLRQKGWHALGAATKSIPIPLTAADAGLVHVRCYGIMDNRLWEEENHIAVEDKSATVLVEIDRFRNKVIPGEEEEWTLKLSNGKGDPLAAEVLLSMYDASLDAIAPHNWYFFTGGNEAWRTPWFGYASLGIQQGENQRAGFRVQEEIRQQEYDKVNWFGWHFWHGRLYARGTKMSMTVQDGIQSARMGSGRPESQDDLLSSYSPAIHKTASEVLEPIPSGASPVAPAPAIRRNLDETAFFLPVLNTNEKGEVLVRFKAPEALTRWNLMGFGHTLALQYALFRRQLVTAKDLMLIPNLPRLLYEGDEIYLKAKVLNQGNQLLTGTAELEIFDVIQDKDLARDLSLTAVKARFDLSPASTDTLIWKIRVPSGSPSLLRVRIKAASAQLSDGEEHLIPVLSSRILITETLPMYLPGKGNRKWHFESLEQGLRQQKVTPHALSLEYTQQPAWNIVKAIPSLLDQGRTSSQQLFNRVYAHTLGYHIVSSQPEIANVLRTWAQYQPDALMSELSRNEDLKAVVIGETPWVRDAADETASRKQLSGYLDINTLSNSLETDARELCALQQASGAWPWFPGMPVSRHMTQQILEGIGELQALPGSRAMLPQCLTEAAEKAIPWVLGTLVADLEDIRRTRGAKWQDYTPAPSQVQALYALSFFMNGSGLKGKEAEAWQFMMERATATWTGFSLHLQAMFGLTALRSGQQETVRRILASLRDRALRDQDLGMYWKSSQQAYYWHEAPVETQALVLTFFTEAASPPAETDAMKIWLLRHKQLNRWETPTATAEACYAILRSSPTWLKKSSGLRITLGSTKIEPDRMPELKQEAGSGYFRKNFKPSEIKTDMSHVQVHTTGNSPSWGALYWQYFQEMSEVKAQQGGLVLRKTISRLVETAEGQVMVPYQQENLLQTGDRVRIRLELEIPLDMEYVHLKDYRPAAMEPVRQVSAYYYQGGLGWYQQVRDAGTDFFFEFLPKGHHILEYDAFVSQEGVFSSGPASLQSLYAPSFNAHTEGLKLSIKNE